MTNIIYSQVMVMNYYVISSIIMDITEIQGYKEVVCLLLGTTLTSQTCSHAFWVLMSLHLSPFLLKIFLLFL